MKEIFDNLRDFILADKKNMNIINKSLSRIQKLNKEEKYQNKDLYKSLHDTIYNIAKAYEKGKKFSAKKKITDRKLESKLKSVIVKLNKIDGTFSLILWLFFWHAKVSIELNVGFYIPDWTNVKRFRKHCNDIIVGFQKSVKVALRLDDLELVNLFWSLNLRTITNIIKAVNIKQNVNSSLEINDNYIEFLKGLGSISSNEWLIKCQIEIQLHRGDCHYYNDDYVTSITEYNKAKEDYAKQSLDDSLLFLRILERIGYVKYRDGFIEEAITVANEALEVTRSLSKKKLENIRYIVKFNHFIGGLFFEKFENLRFSRPFFRIAFKEIKRFEKENIPDLLEIKANLHNNFGMYNIINRNTAKAIEHFEKALATHVLLESRYIKSQYFNIAEMIFRLLSTFYDYLSDETKNNFYDKFLEVIDKKNRDKFSRIGYIESLRFHANILKHKGELKNSLSKLDDALEEFYRLPNSIRKLYNSRILATKLYKDKAQLLFYFEEFNNAEIEIVRALNYLSINTRKSRDLVQLLDLYKSYANILTANNKSTLAKNLFVLLKEFILQQHTNFPKIYEKMYIQICSDKSIIHQRLGEYQNSLTELELANEYLEKYIAKQSVELRKLNLKLDKGKRLDSQNEIIGILNDNFGQTYLGLKEYEKAKIYFIRAFNARKTLYEKNPMKYYLPFLATTNHYSLILNDLNEKDEAETLLKSALIEVKKLEKLELPNINNLKLVFHSNFGLLSIRNKKDRIAIKYYEEVLKLIQSNNLPEVLSITQKAKINWGYETIKQRNPNLKSKKLDELVLFESIKDVEKLPIIEKEKIKADIEHLYLWLLVKELVQLENKQNIDWSKMDFILKIISTLRSGKSYLFKSNQEYSDLDYSNKNSYSELVDEVHNIMVEKEEINKQLFSEHSIISLHQRMQDKSSLMSELVEINKKGFKLISSLQSIYQSKNFVESLKKYLRDNMDTCLYIIQSTPHRIFHLLLKSNSIIIKTTSQDFITIGKKLEKALEEICDIDSIKFKESYDKKNQIIRKISNEFWKVIPTELRNQIDQSKRIIISLCKESQNIPYEIIGDTSQELGLNKVITRIFELESSFITLKDDYRNQDIGNYNMLFLVDPRDLNFRLLRDAPNETKSISQIFEKENYFIDKLVGEEADYSNLFSSLTVKPRIIHYIGHGDKNGVLISTNNRLNPAVITNYYIWFANRPFIYINACDVGKTFYRGSGIFEGLIPSLLRRNSSSIIASKNKIFDDNSRKFSIDFYNLLQTGLSVGEALLETRKKNLEEFIWGNYLLFGDPDFKLK